MWYCIIMITTIILALLGCSTEQSSYKLDARDWELYEPAFDHEPQLPTTIKWSSDPAVAVDLEAVTREWRLHASCGIDFQRVESGADVDFRCADFEFVPNSEASSLDFKDFKDKGRIVVSIDACARGGKALARHAMGHAIGLRHEEKWFETRMSSVALVLEQMHGVQPRYDLDPMEIDGLRYWALSNGAPGCEGDELDWSWNSHPELYNPDTLNTIISELDQGIINR